MFFVTKETFSTKPPPPQTSIGRFWLQNRFVSLPLISWITNLGKLIEGPKGKGRLINRFCNQKRPMNVSPRPPTPPPEKRPQV